MNDIAQGGIEGIEGKFLPRITWTLSSGSRKISLGRKPMHKLNP